MKDLNSIFSIHRICKVNKTIQQTVAISASDNFHLSHLPIGGDELPQMSFVTEE
jgi:hypothetical protein